MGCESPRGILESKRPRIAEDIVMPNRKRKQPHNGPGGGGSFGMERTRDQGAETEGGLRAGVERVGQRMREGYEEASESMAHGYRRAQDLVAQHPAPSVL